MALIIFFRYPSLFQFSLAMARQNKNALANKKILITASMQINHYKIY